MSAPDSGPPGTGRPDRDSADSDPRSSRGGSSSSGSPGSGPDPWSGRWSNLARGVGLAPTEPVLLELNTLPGFTPRSILPKAAAATGVGFRELCLEIAARALARFEVGAPR